MLVVLDSTVLVADRFLVSNDMRLLLSAARNGDLRVAVSEVTLREAVNKVREKAQEALGEVAGGLADLERLRAPVTGLVTDVTAEGVAESYRHFLRDAFDRHGVDVLDIPAVDHVEVVERALLRRKPFDDRGRVGYRDTLIWETIRAAARDSDGPIAFVSANHRDFAEAGAASGLAHALVEELAGDPSSATVELFSLKNFLDEHLRPAAEALDELRDRLDRDAEFRARLEGAIEDAVEQDDPSLEGIDPQRLVEDPGAEYELDEAHFTAVAPGVTHVELLSARGLDDERVLIDLRAEGDVEIDFRVNRVSAHWPWADDDAPRRVGGTRALTLELTVEATYARTSREVTQVRVVAVATRPDPEAERRERARRWITGEPERRAWQRRAAAAAVEWGREQGFERLAAESNSGVDLRSEDGALLIELIDSPEALPLLQSAARKLAMFRRMIGDAAIRTVIVLRHPLEPALVARLTSAIEHPIELYVLTPDGLVPADEAPPGET